MNFFLFPERKYASNLKLFLTSKWQDAQNKGDNAVVVALALQEFPIKRGTPTYSQNWKALEMLVDVSFCLKTT